MALNFLNLPCADSRVCPTEKLLFTGNVLLLFFPHDTFAFPPAVIVIHMLGLLFGFLVGIFYFHQHTPTMKQHLGCHRTCNFCVILVILGAVLKERPHVSEFPSLQWLG